MPIFSVIVPNYNHSNFLAQRIESILNQSFQDFELIILDDCSSDNSRDIISSYKHHPKISQIIFNEFNTGKPFLQWGKGIKMAKGEWIWIAESDDYSELDFLETLLKQQIKYPNAGLIYSHLRWIDIAGNEIHSQENSDEVFFLKGIDFIRERLLYSTIIFNVSSAIFRKDIFENIDHTKYENMAICGDYFLYVLLSEYTNVLEVCRILDNFRITGVNASLVKSEEGINYIEGVEILDYITTRYNVRSYIYSCQYARLWENQLYPNAVNRKIRQSFLKKHKLIIICYYILKIYHSIKRYVV